MSVSTSGAKLGLGATISRDTANAWTYTGGGGTFVRVADCQDVPEVGEARPLVKVTPSDALAEIYIGGVPDGTELTLPFNYDTTNAQQAAMIADCQANTTRPLQASVPGASTKTLTFNAIHLAWGITPKKDGAQMLNIKVKISGGVLLA